MFFPPATLRREPAHGSFARFGVHSLKTVRFSPWLRAGRLFAHHRYDYFS
jgi:hypothetical protein